MPPKRARARCRARCAQSRHCRPSRPHNCCLSPVGKPANDEPGTSALADLGQGAHTRCLSLPEAQMVTPLEKELKRAVNVDGSPYTVIIDPNGMRIVPKGRRKAAVELQWKDLISGEAALATALNASVGRSGESP